MGTSGRHHQRSTRRSRASLRSTSANFAELWCQLSKTDAALRLSRELRVRAVAYRIQEVASGAPRLELQQTGRLRIRPRIKPGTRLMREWRGRSHEVLVLDDGFSWQGTLYRSLSAIARQITGTAWSGPLFFGLRSNWSDARPPARAVVRSTSR